MITRAIFVLTSPEAGEQFLQILPDLRGIGLSEATILHLVSAQPGPAEPMPELANWVRHFEAAIPKVELALKRGDPVKWIYELARVRRADIVVISGEPNGTDWDLERVSSPLRALGIPILFLPEGQVERSLSDKILVAIKSPETLDRAVSGLQEWFGSCPLRAVRIADPRKDEEQKGCSGVVLETVSAQGDVATTLLAQAERWGATLLTILSGENGERNSARTGIPIVKPLIETTERPILIWPANA